MNQITRGWLAIATGLLTATSSACSGRAIDFNSRGGSSGLTGGQGNHAGGGATGGSTAPGGFTTGGFTTDGGSTTDGGATTSGGSTTDGGGGDSTTEGGSTTDGGRTGDGGRTIADGGRIWDGGRAGGGGITTGDSTHGGSPNYAGGGSTSTPSGGSVTWAGGKGGVVQQPGDGDFDCSRVSELCGDTPDGHVIPYSTEAELSTLLVGAWLRCSGNGFPQRGAGIIINADHTWNSVDEGNDGSCKRVTTGFDYYGTWTMTATGDSIQFNLLKIGGGGAGYFPMFSDTGRARLDPGGLPTDYVKAPSLH